MRIDMRVYKDPDSEANEMPHGTASNLSYDDSKKINDIRIK